MSNELIINPVDHINQCSLPDDWAVFASIWCNYQRRIGAPVHYNGLAVAMHKATHTPMTWSQCINLARLLCESWLYGEAVRR